jgi:hypothetical protein
MASAASSSSSAHVILLALKQMTASGEKVICKFDPSSCAAIARIGGI